MGVTGTRKEPIRLLDSVQECTGLWAVLWISRSRTCQQLCDLERVTPQPPPSILLGLESVQSCLGVARVMSEQRVPRSVEQRIVIKFLVGENVPSAEIHHRLQQQYGEECLLRRHNAL